MGFIAENGRVITDEMFDEMAKEYEDGTWSGKLGKLVKGRPSLADEEVRSVSFRLPISRIAAVDKQAARQGETRSKYLRDVVEDALAKAQ